MAHIKIPTRDCTLVFNVICSAWMHASADGGLHFPLCQNKSKLIYAHSAWHDDYRTPVYGDCVVYTNDFDAGLQA